MRIGITVLGKFMDKVIEGAVAQVEGLGSADILGLQNHCIQ